MDNNLSVAHYVKRSVLDLDRQNVRNELADRARFIRLDKNENLHAFDDGPYEEFRQTLTQELVWGYPNLKPLYDKIARQNGVGADQVLVANGSDLAIKAVFDACISPGDQVVLHSPSYFMFDVYTQLAGADRVSVPVDPDWLPDVEKMMAACGPETKMMVIEDPSGFVGTSITSREMAELARRLHERGVLLLIDEAYLYVTADHSEHMGLLGAFDNVVISRTMSKAHGLAGARVGFVMSNAPLMAQIYKCRPLYEVSALSAHAAEWTLDHPEFVAAYRTTVAGSKAKIFAALDTMGVYHRDTRGNFVLIRCVDLSADDLVSRLAESGILVRRPFTDSLITDWVRVTVGGPWATRKFLEALQKALPANRTEKPTSEFAAATAADSAVPVTAISA